MNYMAIQYLSFMLMVALGWTWKLITFVYDIILCKYMHYCQLVITYSHP